MVGGHGTTEHYSSILWVTKNDGGVDGGNARVSIMWVLIANIRWNLFRCLGDSLLYPLIPSMMVLWRLPFDTLRGNSELWRHHTSVMLSLRETKYSEIQGTQVEKCNRCRGRAEVLLGYYSDGLGSRERFCPWPGIDLSSSLFQSYSVKDEVIARLPYTHGGPYAKLRPAGAVQNYTC